MASRSKYGEDCFRMAEKVNCELFLLTYGSLVAQLCRDVGNYSAVNEKLDSIIGVRLIEDFLAKTGSGRCRDFRETMDVVSKVGFRMFLNISPIVSNWSASGDACSLVFEENPLAEFVELPEDGKAHKELWYSNIYCGVLRGALAMVQMDIKSYFVSDVLRGDDRTEMRVEFVRMIAEEMPVGDE